MAQPSYDRQPQYQQQVHQMPETLNPLTNISSMNQKPKQSRLELMRQNYEKKRQKDVEDRLAEMRSQEARTGSGKQGNGGMVRSFFAERRAMEANAKDPYALPSIDRHFKKVKDSSSSAPPRQTRNGHEPYIPPAKSNSAGRKRVPPQYYRKKSKGVDKQNPLPPLQRGQSNSHKPPTPNKRYETHNMLMTDNSEPDQEQQQIQQQRQQRQLEQQKQQQQKLQQQQQQQQRRLQQQQQKQLEKQQRQNQLEQQQREQQQTSHAPQPPQQPNPFRARNTDSRSDFDETSSNYSEEPPPNLTKLKALRQKRLSKQMSLVKQESVEKPTDFQKWQMEQDRERAERLEKHRQKTSQQLDEGEVTLSMRERELLEKIKAEQDKLKEIKRLQQELEDQESDDENNSAYDLTAAEKIDKHYNKQDSYENRIPEKTHQTHELNVLPKTGTKVPDNKSSVRVQPKREKVTQVTINKPPTPDEEESEVNGPKEDFTAFYEQAALADQAVDVSLSPCSICGRNFATDRLARHQKICNKNSKKTRKVFDVQKQRVEGMEHAKYVASGQYKKEPKKPKKADWRIQHENFIKTIRYAKGGSDEPPPVIENPHYVACPYCERKFNPETAERHIPRCKDIKARPAPPKNNNRRKR